MFVTSIENTEMKQYSVKKLARLSGVSVRTLHYYDAIGLLKPSVRTEARYRLYGYEELLRLQQILFYRELKFPLTEIGRMLDSPNFEILQALESHKQSLKSEADRLHLLLSTIDKTITNIKNKTIMLKPEQLYEGLNADTAKSYRAIAVEKYGEKMINDSENALMKLGKEGLQKLKDDFQACSATLFAMKDQDPASEQVQMQIAAHYQFIRRFWGTTNLADKQKEAYAGLGELYVADNRYTTVNGDPQPEFAKFLQKAMTHFAEHNLI